MQVEINGTVCRVTREPHDPKIYNESHLLHKVKQQLNAQGYDLIKKLMWKDGHLVTDHLHYLRARNPRKGSKGIFAVWHEAYAIRMSYEDYNAGKLLLQVEYLED